MEAGELVAARFLSGSQAAIARVCEQPEIGVSKKLKNLKLLGLRSWPVRGFPDIRLY
jgi:toxin ParE1/3/4